MKVYESSRLRPYGSLVRGILTTSAVVAVVWGVTLLLLYGGAGRWRPEFVRLALEQPFFLGVSGIALLTGLPIMLSAFGKSRGSYRVGPTDLEVTGGLFYRNTQWIKFQDITDIRLSQGPLMQLLGTSDLTVVFSKYAMVVLHGVRGARELRGHLLDRRDSLKALEADEAE